MLRRRSISCRADRSRLDASENFRCTAPCTFPTGLPVTPLHLIDSKRGIELSSNDSYFIHKPVTSDLPGGPSRTRLVSVPYFWGCIFACIHSTYDQPIPSAC